LSIFKSISKFITDGLIDIPEITNKSFSDGLFSFVSSLVTYLPTDCEYKYRKKIYVDKTVKLGSVFGSKNKTQTRKNVA